MSFYKIFNLAPQLKNQFAIASVRSDILYARNNKYLLKMVVIDTYCFGTIV